MKILIVQLLRLGDIVLSSPVIRGLRDQYPDVEIDLLINDQFKSVLGILPEVDECYFFERNLIQTSLGEKQRFVFEGYDRVERLVQKLNRRKYDKVINLTHNRLSAYLVGAIDCRERVGLWVDNQDQNLIESAWFRHLNDDDIRDVSERFHFTDIYKRGAEIERPRLRMSLRETTAGRARAQKYLENIQTASHVVVQTLTSDPKKNWGLEAFKSCLEHIHLTLPKTFFTILAAPNEEAQLREFFDELSYASVLVCDLECAYSVLLHSDLVITGDTSIKHIAAATETPIIELSLGSSDFRRTGAYSEKAIIVQSREGCAPCSHSSSCHRESHECATRISPELISLLAIDALRNSSSQMKAIAEEFSDQASVYKVDISSSGVWVPLEVNWAKSEDQIIALVKRFAAKLFIQHRAREKDVFEIFGSESYALYSILKNVGKTDRIAKLCLLKLENIFASQANNISVAEAAFYQNQNVDLRFEKTQTVMRDLNMISVIKQDAALLEESTPPFVRLRKLQVALSDLRLKSDIELKLVRSLQLNMED